MKRRPDNYIRICHLFPVIFLLLCTKSGSSQSEPWEWLHNVAQTRAPQSAPLLTTTRTGGLLAAVVTLTNSNPNSPNRANSWVTRFSSKGSTLWSRSYNGKITGISTDSLGNFYMAGNYIDAGYNFYGLNLDSLHDPNIFLRKCDPFGNEKWTVEFGKKGAENLQSVLHSRDGSFYLTGTFHTEMYFNDSLLFDTTGHLFLARISAEGKCVWAKSGKDLLPVTGIFRYGYDLTEDGQGNIYFVVAGHGRGYAPYSESGILCKVTPEGKVVKSATIGSYSEMPGNVVADKEGNIYFARNHCSHYMRCIGLTKLDTAFNLVWTVSLGNGYDGKQMSYDIKIKNDSTIFACGRIIRPWSDVERPVLLCGDSLYTQGGPEPVILSIDARTGSFLNYYLGLGSVYEDASQLEFDSKENCFVGGNYAMHYNQAITEKEWITFGSLVLYSDTNCRQAYITKLRFSDHHFNDTLIAPTPKNSRLVLYPNPATDEVIVEQPGDYNSELIIVDQTGTMVLRKKITGLISRVNVQHLARALYYVQLSTPAENTSVKLVLR